MSKGSQKIGEDQRTRADFPPNEGSVDSGKRGGSCKSSS